ncbi:hypothetical protein [Kineococcus sp. G2]|uniref:hypothetical protein n=1 Tax=Kineococcus sp. G2 TaxID=3127484 RepID=UPI00301E35C0
MPSHHHRRSLRTAAAGAVALAALGLAGCGSQEDDLVDAFPEDAQEAAVDVADGSAEVVYDGVFDGTFYEQVEDWDGEQVTLTAQADAVVPPNALVLVPEAGTDVDPLLVLSESELDGVEAGETVRVTGALGAAFDLPRFEEDTGVELPDDRYDDYDAEPYLLATSVEVVQ